MARGEMKLLVMADGVAVEDAEEAPSGGGGGGGSAAWWSPDGTGALQTTLNNEKAFEFPDSSDGELWLTLLVPTSYQAGEPIEMDLGYAAVSTSLTVKLKATTYLVNTGTEAFSDTTDSHASTNAAQTNTAPSLEMRIATLDLTSATGTINSVAVAAGDVLRVKLTRDYANDTDTGIVYVIPSATEVRFVAS